MASIYLYSTKAIAPLKIRVRGGRGNINPSFELHNFRSTNHIRSSVNAVCAQLHFAYQMEIFHNLPPLTIRQT
jgi:hypothetical protein